MHALVVQEPNVLEIQEKPVPEPGRNEVLARVRSTAICGTDAHLIQRRLPRLLAARLPVHAGPRVGR